MVRKTGLEPVRLTAHAPQTCLSANSSTSAGELFNSNKVYLNTAKQIVSRQKAVDGSRSLFNLRGSILDTIRDVLEFIEILHKKSG